MPEVGQLESNFTDEGIIVHLSHFRPTLGLYWEDGCSEEFLIWLRAWAGGVSAAHIIVMGLMVSTIWMVHIVQGWAKEWTLGCVNPTSWLPLAAGGEFTQPRAHL